MIPALTGNASHRIPQRIDSAVDPRAYGECIYEIIKNVIQLG